jgi:hypothetical protein
MNEAILERTRVDINELRAACASAIGETALSQTEVDEKCGLMVEPLVSEYARVPITESFDWSDILDQATDKLEASPEGYYLVVFGSHLIEGADTELLKELDDMAYAEARKSESLIHYFAGERDEEGHAISWCLWSNRAAAEALANGPWHMLAKRMVVMYDDHSVDSYFVNPTEDSVDLRVPQHILV